MPTVSLPINGRRYDVTCREGEQARLIALAAHIDDKVTQASASAGRIDEVRGFLYAALLLADEGQSGAMPSPDALAGALERMAGRIESLAERLEAAAAAWKSPTLSRPASPPRS